MQIINYNKNMKFQIKMEKKNIKFKFKVNKHR